MLDGLWLCCTAEKLMKFTKTLLKQLLIVRSENTLADLDNKYVRDHKGQNNYFTFPILTALPVWGS